MAQERSDIDGLDRLDRSSGEELDEVRNTASTDLAAASSITEDDDLPPEAEQIKAEIEETRSQMGETIDAIQEKLSFANISDQVSDHVTNAVETAKTAVYEATLGKAANIMKTIGDELSRTSFIQTAKSNPLPFILMGLGAGLLVYQNYSGGTKTASRSRRLRSGAPGSHETTEYRNTTTGAGSGGTSYVDSATSAASGALDSARETIGGAASSVSSAASSALSSVGGVVESARTGAGQAVSTAYNKVGDLGSTARDQYDHYIEENPLAVGAVALALGAAVGMALPSTRYEGQLMGSAKQQLMDRAQTTASDLLDRTKEMATEAGRTLTDQAKNLTEH
jgi:hypothetical protein